ncbi:MAG: undecaprenyl-diphosphate phosphatase [Phycisphaerales bacterium]
MLETWQAVVLGLVEGITEYLPISSTGHLIVSASLMGLHDNDARAEAVKTFEIAIQGGAIAAVLGLYFPRFVQMLKGLLGKDDAGFALLVNIGIAFVPAAVVGLLLKDAIDKYLFNIPAVIIAFIIGGVFMIVIDRKLITPKRFAGPSGGGKEITDLTPGDAVKIGLLQVLSLWPGTSRSMTTITGGAMCGLRPAAAAEFSFLLGMPTLLAATGYSLFKNIREAHKTGAPNMFQQLGYAPVLVGALVAAVSAAVAVHWLVGFLNKRGLAPFGYYRLIAAVVLFVLMLMGAATAGKH